MSSETKQNDNLMDLHDPRANTVAYDGCIEISFDEQLKIIDCNLFFVKLLGYESPEELNGKKISSFWADHENQSSAEERIRALGRVELAFKKANGKRVAHIMGGIDKSSEKACYFFKGVCLHNI